MKMKTTLAPVLLLPLLALPGGVAVVPLGHTGVLDLTGDLAQEGCVIHDVHMRYVLSHTRAGWVGNVTLRKGADHAEGPHHDHAGVVLGAWDDPCLTMTTLTPWESQAWSMTCREDGAATMTVHFWPLADTLQRGPPLVFEGAGTCAWT